MQMEYAENTIRMTDNDLSHSSASRRNTLEGISASRSLAIDPPSPTGTSSGDDFADQPTSPGRIARPRNSFMIFRSEFLANNRITRDVEKDNRHISRIVGLCWKKLSAEEKQPWNHKAELEKIAHRAKHPTYKFSPVPRAKKPLKRKGKRNGEKDMERCQVIADMISQGKEGDQLAAALKRVDLGNAEDNDEDTSETHETPEMPGEYAYYPLNDSHMQVFMNPLCPPRPPPAPNTNLPSVNDSAYYPNTYSSNNLVQQQQYYPSPPESPASPNYMYSNNAYALHPSTFYQQQSSPVTDTRNLAGTFSAGIGYSAGPSQGHIAYEQPTGYQFAQHQHGSSAPILDSFVDESYYGFSPPSPPPTAGPSRYNFNNNFLG